MKAKRFLLAMFAILTCIQVWSEDYDTFTEKINGWDVTFEVISETDRTCMIIDCDEHISGNVIIPGYVYGNKYEVVKIDFNAFENCAKITSITIPKEVTDIYSNESFSGCIGLTSIIVDDGNPVYDSRNGCNAIIYTNNNSLMLGCSGTTIPNSVKYIGSGAFSGCTELTSIEIPNSVTHIGQEAFRGCTGLTSIEIPNSVTSIGQSAFSDCTNLTSVTVETEIPIGINNGTFSNRANATLYVPAGSKAAYEAANYWKEFKEIIELPIAFADSNVKTLCVSNWDTNGDGELSVDEAAAVTSLKVGSYQVFQNNVDIISFDELSFFTGLTSIENNAFSGCTNLTSIVIPNSVKSIGEEIVYGCTNLASLDIPNSVTTIGAYAFWNSGLTELSIPNSVTSIGRFALAGCASLNSCTISNSVTSIPQSMFQGCSSLSTIIIPNSVTRIEEQAFKGCSTLSSITIGTAVTNINGYYTFDGCNSLSVNILDLTAWFSISFETSASNPLAKAHHLYLNGNEITNLVIPNSVTNINDFAFYDCDGLMSVTIPNSVTSIGEKSFNSCSGLTSVSIPNSVTTIGNYAFSGCSYLTSVTLGNSITNIGEHSFDNCSRLTSLFVNIEDPLDVYLWLSQRNKVTLYVPRGCKATYEGSTNWSGFKEIVEMANDISIGSAGMGTFCSTYPLDFSGTDDIMAYIVSAFKPSTGEVILTRITDVPANTGIVVKGNEGSYPIPWGAGETVVANMLVGVTENTVLNKVDGDYTNYILTKKNGSLGFYAVTDGSTLSAGKAYLPLPTAQLPSAARPMKMIFSDDEATGIEQTVSNGEQRGDYYDLQGRRVAKPTHGLYIVNGKKVFFK